MRGNLMDIYLDRIALKQVLNLNFLQLCAAQRLTVPLAQRRRGHQFDVVHQQAVSHVGLLQFLHLGRRNDDGLHIAVVQHINQRITLGNTLTPIITLLISSGSSAMNPRRR